MAVFKSKYKELSFYVDGKLHSFAGGGFSTNDPNIIAVLSSLKDVQRVDDPKENKAELKSEVKEQPIHLKEQKPKASKTKASGK